MHRLRRGAMCQLGDCRRQFFRQADNPFFQKSHGEGQKVYTIYDIILDDKLLIKSTLSGAKPNERVCTFVFCKIHYASNCVCAQSGGSCGPKSATDLSAAHFKESKKTGTRLK